MIDVILTVALYTFLFVGLVGGLMYGWISFATSDISTCGKCGHHAPSQEFKDNGCWQCRAIARDKGLNGHKR